MNSFLSFTYTAGILFLSVLGHAQISVEKVETTKAPQGVKPAYDSSSFSYYILPEQIKSPSAPAVTLGGYNLGWIVEKKVENEDSEELIAVSVGSYFKAIVEETEKDRARVDTFAKDLVGENTLKQFSLLNSSFQTPAKEKEKLKSESGQNRSKLAFNLSELIKCAKNSYRQIVSYGLSDNEEFLGTLEVYFRTSRVTDLGSNLGAGSICSLHMGSWALPSMTLLEEAKTLKAIFEASKEAPIKALLEAGLAARHPKSPAYRNYLWETTFLHIRKTMAFGQIDKSLEFDFLFETLFPDGVSLLHKFSPQVNGVEFKSNAEDFKNARNTILEKGKSFVSQHLKLRNGELK